MPMKQQQVKSNFKTLTPQDPEFSKYMMGSFSETARAIPQSSLNIKSMNEIVTFEIKGVEFLDSVPLIRRLWLLLKPSSWLTVLVPLVMIANLEPGEITGIGTLLAGILVLLMVFANWQADLADHLAGWDRLMGGINKSVLQKGWYTGFQLNKWSKLVILSASILSLPLLIKFPWALISIAITAMTLLALLPRWWRKTVWPGLASLCIFLLTGPLLTIGIDFTFDGTFSWNSLFLGISWGLWMSFVRQQKIYSRQWILHKKQAPYFVLGFGFDRSKSLMRLLIPIVALLMGFSILFVNGGAAWFLPLVMIQIAFVFFELQLNEKIQTSIGSPLETLQKVFVWHHYAISMVMIIGSFIWKRTH